MSDPWSPPLRRRARWFIAALFAGPVLATVTALLVVPHNPETQLGSAPHITRTESIDVSALVRNLDAVRGEVTVLLNFAPNGTLNDNGRLTRPVSVLVGLVNSDPVVNFPAGQPMASVERTLTLAGTRVVRYPLDRYTSKLIVIGGDEAGDSIPVNLAVRGNFNDFVSQVTNRPRRTSDQLAEVDLSYRRNTAVKLWAGLLTLLFWLLAAGSVSVVWHVVVEGSPIPFWAWGFMAGVLFALPPLRNGLPGSPRLGSLVDWAAFYWAILVVGGSLVGLLVLWNIRLRRDASTAG